MTVCKKVVYSGRVQGVGFRYTAQRLAAGLPVSGYVKNLPNGAVELVVEGEAEQVEAFLQRIARHMRGYIVDTETSLEEPQNIAGFRIKY